MLYLCNLMHFQQSVAYQELEETASRSHWHRCFPRACRRDIFAFPATIDNISLPEGPQRKGVIPRLVPWRIASFEV